MKREKLHFLTKHLAKVYKEYKDEFGEPDTDDKNTNL